MFKGLLLMSAAIIAAPALAQAEAAPPASSTPQPAAAAQTPPAADPTQVPNTAATPAAPAASSPTAAATPAPTGETATPANSSNAVASVVSADWAKYDKDGDGKLSKGEFAAWMTALRESNPAQKAAVADVNAWTNAAFAQADKDKSNGVSKEELEAFLKG